MVVIGIASSYLALPVEAETNLVELLTISGNILFCCNGRMLSCLNGILLGGQSVGIVTHGVEHIVAL